MVHTLRDTHVTLTEAINNDVISDLLQTEHKAFVWKQCHHRLYDCRPGAGADEPALGHAKWMCPAYFATFVQGADQRSKVHPHLSPAQLEKEEGRKCDCWFYIIFFF